MTDLDRQEKLATLTVGANVDADAVLSLRREVFGDGLVSRAEAGKLLAIDAGLNGTGREWQAFVVEAIADFVVHQEMPSGYVSAGNAQWLVEALEPCRQQTRIEILIGVLERAKSAPASLSAHALKCVADNVLADGHEGRAAVVCKADVAQLRRILYAFGGGEGIGVSREEADVLFMINDRAAETGSDAEWSELFVKAIANFVMCASGYRAPSREEALRHEAFIDAPGEGVGGFLRRMAAGGARGILDAYRDRDGGVEDAFAERNATRAAAAAQAEAVDAGEAEWLVARIGGDRPIHDNEKALLAFIGRESPSVHPSIRDLIARVA